MTTTSAPHRLGTGERAFVAGTVLVFTGLCIAAGIMQLQKLLVIALVSFGAMALGAALGLRTPARAAALTWAYGASAGAMVASASAFLLPVAINQNPRLGGFGIAAGVLAGFAVHELGERVTRRASVLDDNVVRLTLHALTAGAVIGAIYTTLPGIGLLLGLSIVSHKGPAGYAAARAMHGNGRSVLPLAVPAAAIGIPAITLGLLGWPLSDRFSAVVFGVGAGVFLHLAIDFLPRRGPVTHAVASVVAGAAAVVLAWAVVSFAL